MTQTTTTTTTKTTTMITKKQKQQQQQEQQQQYQRQSWSTVVLIPKGNGDYRGVGLLELFLKVIESIINWWIAGKVRFHDSLHGFIAKRGTGTTCIEAKLLQQLSRMVQKSLYYIFLDSQKAYDTVDWERLLEILEGYGVGLNALGLLKFYWENQRCVARSRNYHGSVFVPER